MWLHSSDDQRLAQNVISFDWFSALKSRQSSDHWFLKRQSHQLYYPLNVIASYEIFPVYDPLSSLSCFKSIWKNWWNQHKCRHNKKYSLVLANISNNLPPLKCKTHTELNRIYTNTVAWITITSMFVMSGDLMQMFFFRWLQAFDTEKISIKFIQFYKSLQTDIETDCCVANLIVKRTVCISLFCHCFSLSRTRCRSVQCSMSYNVVAYIFISEI